MKYKRRRKRMHARLYALTALLLMLVFGSAANRNTNSKSTSYPNTFNEATTKQTGSQTKETADGNQKFSYEMVPAYTNSPSTVLHDNQPFFDTTALQAVSYENYGEQDSLGRCSVCEACIGEDLMPTEKRGNIGQIRPSGWHTVNYHELVDGNYLYNRCHLIAYELCAENANAKNLITGTRYMNTQGMLPYENQVCEYIKRTKNHVQYRVTPVFLGNDLVARGVLMEAFSIEDQGRGICFCVFCYNIQPHISISYDTGESCRTS